MPVSSAPALASRSLGRAILVVLIAGFLVFDVPRAVVGLTSGEPDRQINAVVGLLFWAWLMWRLVVLIRKKEASRDPRYWYLSAGGFAVFAVLFLVSEMLDAVTGDFDARSVPFTVIVTGLAVLSAATGRRVARSSDAGARV